MTAPYLAPRNPRAAWLATAAAVVAVVVWNVAAWVIDLSPLQQQDTSWGFAFATMIYTGLVGMPLLTVTAISSGIAQARPQNARVALVIGALACAAVAVMLVVLLALTAADGGMPLTSDRLFLVSSIVVAAGLLVPVVKLRSTVAATTVAG